MTSFRGALGCALLLVCASLLSFQPAKAQFSDFTNTECTGKCERVSTKCVMEGEWCESDSYKYNPWDPCNGNTRLETSGCPICSEGLYCVMNKCVAPSRRQGELCCPTPSTPTQASSCTFESGLRDKFCMRGTECNYNAETDTNICERTATTSLVWLQFGDECDEEARPWEVCYGILGCDPTQKICRYNVGDQWSDRPFTDQRDCSSAGSGLSMDYNCPFGNYCEYDPASGNYLCKQGRGDDNSCKGAFVENTAGGGEVRSFTGACAHNKICVVNNPYGNLREEEAKCVAPFSLGEGKACIPEGNTFSFDQYFQCKEGLGCVCDDFDRCQCSSVDVSLKCGNECNSAKGIQEECPPIGTDLTRVPSCANVASDAVKYFKQRWAAEDSKFFACLEANECQIREPNSKCALDPEHDCVKFLKYNVTYEKAALIFSAGEAARNWQSVTEGVKFTCATKHTALYWNYRNAAPRTPLPQAWILASLSLAAFFLF